MQLLRQFFAIFLQHRIFAEYDFRLEAGHLEQIEYVRGKTHVTPPAHREVRRNFPGFRAIAEAGIMYWLPALHGKFQQRGLQGIHLRARTARAFREERDAFAARQGRGNQISDAHHVFAHIAVDVNRSHHCGQMADDGPALDVVPRDERAAELRGQQDDVEVAQVIGDQQKRRLGRLATHPDAHAENFGHAAGPSAKNPRRPVAIAFAPKPRAENSDLPDGIDKCREQTQPADAKNGA